MVYGKILVNVSKKIDGSSFLLEGLRGVGVVGVIDFGEGFVFLGGVLFSDRWEYFFDFVLEFIFWKIFLVWGFRVGDIFLVLFC